MKRMTVKAGLFLILTVIMAGCASVKREELTFNGMIYNDNNEAVSDVAVYLNGKEVSVTDIYGHFSIYNLKNNTDYVIKTVKKGYESSEMEFTFLNASQVLYLRMYSADELLAKAEKLIAEKKYELAEQTLVRSEKAEAPYLSVNYLRAVLNYNKRNYDEALAVMQNLLEQEYYEPYIYLFMADIYQYGFNNFQETKNYLKKYLECEYSEDVSERLKELN